MLSLRSSHAILSGIGIAENGQAGQSIAVGANPNLAPALRALSDEERRFLVSYIESGNAENAKAVSGYHISVQGSDLLRRPHIATALRWEVARQLATDGARIGYGCLKRIAQDQKAPAAAQVAAAKALLQGAGLLDAPQQREESKSINDMSREELRAYIESKRHDIEKMEAALADRALDITPSRDSEPVDPFE